MVPARINTRQIKGKQLSTSLKEHFTSYCTICISLKGKTEITNDENYPLKREGKKLKSWISVNRL